jgi:hypothetical protein
MNPETPGGCYCGVRYWCPILATFRAYVQSLVKLYIIKFHEKPPAVVELVTCREADIMKLTGGFLQVISQKMVLFITIAVKTSNPTFCKFVTNASKKEIP